jgi:hypothetical protein
LCRQPHNVHNSAFSSFPFQSLEETLSVREIAAPLVPVPVLYPGKKTSVVQPFFMGFQFYKNKLKTILCSSSLVLTPGIWFQFGFVTKGNFLVPILGLGSENQTWFQSGFY